MNCSTWYSTSPDVYISTNLTTNDLSIWGVLNIFVACFNLLLGLPMHCYIMWFIVKRKGGGIASDFFMLNLTFCETIFSLNALLFVLSLYVPSVLLLFRFLLGISITGRPLFQSLICVERYLAVVHPVTFLKFKPLRYKILCSASAWIVILGSCLFCMISVILSNIMAYTWFYIIQFLLFLFIQLFCGLAVLRALKQSGPGEKGREREEENHVKRRAFYLILVTTVTMVIMFSPYIFTGLLVVLQFCWISVIWFVSFCCFVLAAFVHPVIYLQRNGQLNCFCSPKKILFLC